MKRKLFVANLAGLVPVLMTPSWHWTEMVTD